MYDDYDLDYTSGNDYGQDLDEYTQELDEDYVRDSTDYETLAYKHYAWYNAHISHENPMLAQKRLVRITLDIMCYDDLDVEDMDWKEILELQGDEEVYSTVKDYERSWCDSLKTGTDLYK